jgi:hypothetical protein
MPYGKNQRKKQQQYPSLHSQSQATYLKAQCLEDKERSAGKAPLEALAASVSGAASHAADAYVKC